MAKYGTGIRPAVRGYVTAGIAAAIFLALSDDVIEWAGKLLAFAQPEPPVSAIANIAIVAVLGFGVGYANGRTRTPAAMLAVGFLIIPVGFLAIFFLTIVGWHPYIVGNPIGWAPVEMATIIALPTLAHIAVGRQATN